MENLTDYSNYIFAAYAIAGTALASLMALIVIKYFRKK
jgi:hypothetical protein